MWYIVYRKSDGKIKWKSSNQPKLLDSTLTFLLTDKDVEVDNYTVENRELVYTPYEKPVEVVQAINKGKLKVRLEELNTYYNSSFMIEDAEEFESYVNKLKTLYSQVKTEENEITLPEKPSWML